jgi:hypothetical protein
MSKQLKPTGKKYGRFILFFDHLPDGEPCLCLGSRTARDLIPGFIVPNSVKSKRSAFVIPLKMAYLYAESKSGEPSHYLMQRSFLIADHLGLDTEKSTIRNIVDAILDGIPDLIGMMPLDTSLTMKQIEQKAEKHGLVAKLDGKTILDAS